MSPRPPADAVVALRSLPRRFRSLFVGIDDDESPDDLANRPGPDGRSVLDHLAAATEAMGGTRPAAVGIDASLAALSSAAEALATRSTNVGAAEWARPTAVEGIPATALEALWRKVDAAIAALRSAERTLAEVRGR